MSYMNGFSGGGHGGHHGGHHGGGHGGGGGGFFAPMMIGPSAYPWYQEPSTIEIITTGDDVCIACRAGTVKGPACDKCPGIKYAGWGADTVGWGTAAGSLAAVAVLGGLIWYLSRGKRRSPRRVRRRRRSRSMTWLRRRAHGQSGSY